MDTIKKRWILAAFATTAAAVLAAIARSGAVATGRDDIRRDDVEGTSTATGMNGHAATGSRPHVVIVGGGFAGLTAARTLGDTDVRVTLIDRANHHVFQPLLYQVALATLAPSDISAPIRLLLRRYKNIEVLMANVAGIDTERGVVRLDGSDDLPYDYLILATGSRHAYFGHPKWEEDAPGLKSLDDALTIRNRFLTAFEQAEKCNDPIERAAWQTFVIVGGGPTGVELAGLIPEIASRALRPDYHRIDTRRTRVILVEAGSRIMPAFPESLASHARRDLEELGVDVRVGKAVEQIAPDAVVIDGERIAARTILWAAGNTAPSILADLDAPRDKGGRVLVDPDLAAPGRRNVFVVGDSAAFVDRGKPVPGVAPAANQEGACAARNILADLAGCPRETFRYFDKGNLATIGRQKAIADFGFVRITGHAAWWLWLFVHILYLAGFRNRLSVLLQWAYAYVTYQRGVRLISGRVSGAERGNITCSD